MAYSAIAWSQAQHVKGGLYAGPETLPRKNPHATETLTNDGLMCYRAQRGLSK